MNQWITIAKICGAAGDRVLENFSRWHQARVPVEGEHDLIEGHMEPKEWPLEIRREADRFVSALANNATQPPVLFYCRYVDMWSMFDVFFGIAELARTEIVTNVHDLLCFDLEQNASLMEDLKRLLRRRSIHEETRWYATHLREAIKSWQPTAPNGALVVVREVVGGLVMDSEIEEALKGVPDWL